MLTAQNLTGLQSLLKEQELDGWLLFDFKGRNPIAAAVLGDWIVGTRRIFVLVRRSEFPIAIVHEIDEELWRDWPSEWPKVVWVYEQELKQALAHEVRGLRLAVDFSPHGASPYLDCVPAGAIGFLSEFECTLASSAELVTHFLSVWTDEDRRSHERAAERVADIAQYAMRRASESVGARLPISEFSVVQWIREAFEREGLIAESGPSVCIGANAARNHYEALQERAAPIVPGQMLLVDLWAKEPSGIYADQTWMSCIGRPSDRDAHLWKVVREARDAALDLLEDRVRNRRPVTGAEVDLAARQVIVKAGLESGIAGRTGHSIDRFGLHGFGPTIDGTETRDRRALVPGIGFSIEPGIYLKAETGVRSEVNVYLSRQEVLVTPHSYQRELLIL